MRTWTGIDLGSTTTKAVVLDEGARIIGRGITNSRSNYDVACRVALAEAVINTRFFLLSAELDRAGVPPARRDSWLEEMGRRFREQQYLGQLAVLREILLRLPGASAPEERHPLARILDRMREETDALFAAGAERKSDFFRDIAGSRYLRLAEEEAREKGARFDALAGLFDKAILDAENTPTGEGDFERYGMAAVGRMRTAPPELRGAVERAVRVDLERAGSVGTGYGRARLPFPRRQIRSEILCHGLGAHAMFPGTRTVLDIGGQDTKAIQVDEAGIVTSFQMNDRCAAGCGRYLGYIADEMNLGLHELGPLAGQATRPVRINSTCTVFAGAELRERLSLGEQREDILAGLHRAIILRAMSLLARSGGVADEFTFTGGVARNSTAVSVLRSLVRDNYGERRINISPDSIYTGALGAALFALRGSAAGHGAEEEAAASAAGGHP
ncbi:MAG: benzoyl-CoA reductase subunit A [Planctomycetaceae bacterium]|nr:benzoyl-CoA reductase subunit A [Planctomycetota bacterium]NUN52060.1 benzoyl-CoA reductase subunit A [Planctomycetaceae bacterium]